MVSPSATQIESRWNESHASGLDPVELLVYASNLLGSDLRITNFGGGNTSSKVKMPDPFSGEEVEVLWVKGSGGDLGSATRANFASLYQGKVLSLQARHASGTHEDDIVGLYSHCIFGQNPAAPSIDTPLHALVPAPCVSHMHSDSVIAIAASDKAKELTETIWNGKLGFLPWKRPGFDLGVMLQDLINANPTIQGALMESHGFICWADDWKTCYELTIKFVNEAQAFIEAQTQEHPFGAIVRTPNSGRAWEDILPELRGMMSYNGQNLVASVDSDAVTLDFLSRSKAPDLIRLGTSCPDHFLRTKIRPLLITDLSRIESAVEEFRRGYAAYYERCKRPDSPAIRNPNPSVVLIPGMGIVSFGKNAQEAKVTGQFYRNAIEVMRGAESVGTYQALPEQEAFDIEYWLLEEAKLQRMPPEKELSRMVAVVTGAANGIGLATARKLASLGACVALIDINPDALSIALDEVQRNTPFNGNVLAVQCDVTNPASVEAALASVVRQFGGVDIAVIGAGNARRGTLAETSLEDYDYLSNLLMKGYFLTAQTAIKIMQRQKTGGSLVFIGSKNGVATGSNAAIYSAAKAFELHLMRTVAVDHAKDGIRSNAINPDAVLSGSAIWSDQWRAETATLLGIAPSELEDHYRKRSLLGVAVTADDCAEAICWLASPTRSGRTTGCVIPVDGGNREGFLR